MDRDIALGTMNAAKKYILPLLEERCRNILTEGLAPSNIWEVYTSSIMTPDDELHTACQKYFRSNITNVDLALRMQDFKDIPNCVLLDMLQLNDSKTDLILLSQIEVFKACNAWAEAECLRQELDPSGENKRTALGDCLFLIGFPSMFPKDLVRIVFPTGILSQDEKCALLECAHGEDSSQKSPSLQFMNNPCILNVTIKPIPDTESIREYSAIKKCNIEYSSIKLEASKDLGLQRIWLKTNDLTMVRTKHIIVIEGNTQNTPSKSVFSNLIKCRWQDRVFKLLIFEEQRLEAGCKYQIKVEKHGSEVSHNEVAQKYHSTKQHATWPSQVGLKVTGKEANDSIVCLHVRFV